jgi:hypothetical protein
MEQRSSRRDRELVTPIAPLEACLLIRSNALTSMMARSNSAPPKCWIQRDPNSPASPIPLATHSRSIHWGQFHHSPKPLLQGRGRQSGSIASGASRAVKFTGRLLADRMLGWVARPSSRRGERTEVKRPAVANKLLADRWHRLHCQAPRSRQAPSTQGPITPETSE